MCLFCIFFEKSIFKAFGSQSFNINYFSFCSLHVFFFFFFFKRHENERFGESGGTAVPSNHLTPKRAGTPKKHGAHKRTATAEHADQLFANLNAFVAEIEGDDDQYVREHTQKNKKSMTLE